MSLVELLCPKCGCGLDPRPGQCIHACRDCGSSWEAIPSHGLVPVPRGLVRPRIAPSPDTSLILLPVWCIKVHREKLPDVADRMAEEIRVPATGLARLPLLVGSARRLTRAASTRADWSGIEALVDPAEIDAETAFAVAESVALRHVPGWPKEQDVESVSIPLGGANLVDWPCAVEGSDLVELVGGLSLPVALVENMRPREQQATLAGAILGMNLPREYTPTQAGS
jgi:hypothetical protein